MRTQCGIVASAVISCLVAMPCVAQSITVSFDREQWSCHAGIQPGSHATWYIWAQLAGASLRGITAAEFRQDGTPAGWLMTATPEPGANLVWGDPLAGGCDIGFATCQTGSRDGIVVLYTMQGTATYGVGRTCLTVNRHTTPFNPALQCPVQVLCDAPTYTAICAGSGLALINGNCFLPPYDCSPTAVAVQGWSHMKALYR